MSTLKEVVDKTKTWHYLVASAVVLFAAGYSFNQFDIGRILSSEPPSREIRLDGGDYYHQEEASADGVLVANARKGCVVFVQVNLGPCWDEQSPLVVPRLRSTPGGTITMPVKKGQCWSASSSPVPGDEEASVGRLRAAVYWIEFD